MITRPVDGKEKALIERESTEAGRIDVARHIAHDQGAVDERFNLKHYIEDVGGLRGWFLHRSLRFWFDQRNRDTNDHGLGWNECAL